jgi:lambda repressor-like predicted transcriptional regulator
VTAVEPLLLDSPPAMPCLHKRVQHQHGTMSAYALDRCRCAPCREAKSTYEKHRKRQIAYGRWNAWVDAQPARAHVLDRIERTGISWRLLAHRAGLSEDTMERLLYGIPTRRIPRSRRIRRDTANKLVSAVGLWPANTNSDLSTPRNAGQ